MAAETTCPFKEQQYGLGTHTTKKGTNVTIRLATVDDVSEIRRLIVGLALYEKEPEETVEVTEDELRRDGFGAQPVFRCLLAEVDGVAIGFALFFYNYSTWQGKCIYLEDLYVEEAGRGTGTGTLLLKTVAAIAHAEGCKRMSWQALDWFVCGVLVVMGRGDGVEGGRERYAIDATRHSCEHRNTPALDFYKALGANRLDSWVNLRLGEKELTQLLGIS